VRARRAGRTDVEAICRICAEGWRDTYRDLYPSERIERTIAHFYNADRVGKELDPAGGWDGWWVTEDESGEVVAAGGGGMTGPLTGEVFVLYVDSRGAREQWVAVAQGNEQAISFYRARGFRARGTRPAYGEADPAASESLLFWRPLD